LKKAKHQRKRHRVKGKVRHFKSREAYRKWLAYGHMRTPSGRLARRPSESIFARTPGHQRIVIAGRPHRVQHKKKK